MNQYKLFFTLLYDLMGAVMKGKATIERLNAILARAIERPDPTDSLAAIEIPSAIELLGQRKPNQVARENLNEADWERLSNFADGSKFERLVRAIREKGERGVVFANLRHEGAIGANEYGYQFVQELNTTLKRAGLPYSLRQVPRIQKGKGWNGATMKIVVLDRGAL